MYPTLRATVRQGRVELLEDITLPEDATLLITVLDDSVLEALSLGDHLIAGLQDVMLGRVTEVNTPEELDHHLDVVFND